VHYQYYQKENQERTVLRRRREIKKKDKGSKMKEGNTKTHDRMKINTNSMHVSVRI